MDQLGGYGSDVGSDSEGAPVIQAEGEGLQSKSSCCP